MRKKSQNSFESDTTGKAGGLIYPLKAVDVQPPKGDKTRRSLERQIHLTVVTPVLLLLFSYVFANQLPVTPHRADIVASRPERLPGEVPAAAVAMPRNPDCAFAFDETDNCAHLVLGRNGYQHVNMVGPDVPFLDPALLLARQFMEHAAEILPQQSEQTPAAVFRYEHHMILAFPFRMC